MKTYVDQRMIPLGKVEGEIIKNSHPIRPAKPGETIFTFGKYAGYSMEYVNEFDHQYIIFVSTIKTYGSARTQPFVDRAMQLTTLEERNNQRERKKYYNKKCEEIKWLADFLKEVNQANSPWSKFAYSILRRLWSQHQLNLLTVNQLKCIANMWGEVKSGHKDGAEFRKARDEFKMQMKPYWKRKYDRIEDL